jgi:glycosyltransferase involved in cell wall biosynthesis
MRVAIVHDFLLEYGGAERVLEVLHEMYPDAPVYTAMADWKRMGKFAERFKGWDIRTSFMQKHYFTRRFYSPLRWLAPTVWESFNFDEYDVVITSSSWYITHGIITRPETTHICYLHTVPRYLYGYKTKMNWTKHLLTRMYGRVIGTHLRQYDFLAAQRVDQFVANSDFTKRRINKFYRREAKVIYPPVDIPINKKPTENKREYLLCVGRLVSSKHFDLAIKAANNLRLPLWIVGNGPEREALESISGGTIKFLGNVSDLELEQIYAGAKAMIFPSEEEDFGIVPVEAMAHGVPVVGYNSGGIPETVIQGKTGVLFGKLSAGSIAKAVKLLDRLHLDPNDCRKQAKKYSKEKFIKEISELVSASVKANLTGRTLKQTH